MVFPDQSPETVYTLESEQSLELTVADGSILVVVVPHSEG
jgi:hypothetical protein